MDKLDIPADEVEVWIPWVGDGSHPLDQRFRAVLHPDRWNGFACPSFRYEEAEKIAAWTLLAMKECGEDSDLVLAFAGQVWHGYYDEGVWILDKVETDRYGGYSIGAWGWTWETYRED